MSFDCAVIARVPPHAFSRLLAAGLDSGRSLLEREAPSLGAALEGTFVERPLRIVAPDVPTALRKLGLPLDAKVMSRAAGTEIELVLEGRLDHRSTVDHALRAMVRESEKASFAIRRDPVRGELHVTGKLGSSGSLNGWLEPLLLVAMAAETLGGEGRAAVFADGDDYTETLVADVYRVESGRLVVQRLDPPNDGFEATRTAFAAHGLQLDG